MNKNSQSLPIIVAGGGIGGLAAALALTRQGFRVKVLEKSPELGEIGAGVQFGPNAYSKPATGLNILRETIMGREAFDYAFKEYARRWAFKHPQPADLFRTLEDASGEDLDWFWRGWFYSTEACDISLDSVKHAVVDVNDAATGFGAGNREFKTKRSADKPILNSFEDIAILENKGKYKLENDWKNEKI